MKVVPCHQRLLAPPRTSKHRKVGNWDLLGTSIISSCQRVAALWGARLPPTIQPAPAPCLQAKTALCSAPRHCAGGSSLKVISADKHIVNIWDASTAQNMTSLQPQAPGINDVLHWKGSGLIMLGLDAPRIQACPLLLHPSLSPAGAPVHASLVCCCSLNA